MIVLALDTSTARGSVSVCSEGALLAEEISHQQKKHADFINVGIERVLANAHLSWSSIDAIAVTEGPGSFTGLRVAGNAAKALSFAQQKPIVAVSTLEVLAYQVDSSTLPIVCILNAYKNSVYLAEYQKNNMSLELITPPQVLDLPTLELAIKKECLCIGDGYRAYEQAFSAELKSRLHRQDGLDDYPPGRALGALATMKYKNGQTLDWKSFLPLYIRESAAEENLRKGLIKSHK